MKARIGFCTWRPLVGAAVVGALAIAVSVQGSPRVGGERDKSSDKSQASRVVTGPSAHINSAIAQAGTTTISLQPVVAPGTAVQPAGHTGYAAANITGAKVTLPGLPARVWMELQITGFASLSPPLATWQAAIDSSGYAGASAVCSGAPANGGDLMPASQPCAVGTDCRATMSGASALCSGSEVSGCQVAGDPNPGFCFAGYQDTCKANWINVGAIAAVATSTLNYAYGSTPLGAGPTDFAPSYGGHLVLEVPTTAKGLYTIGFDPNPGNTFLLDNQSPQVNIPIAALNPAQIDIPCGSCCTNLGPGTSICTDSVTNSGCQALPTTNTHVFRSGVTCAEQPCPACLTNADCNDNDKCTQDICTNFVCSNPPVAGWDQTTQCCNASTGNIVTILSTNQCTAASCTIEPGNRGDLLLTPRTGQSCVFPNDCKYDHTCTDGVTCSGLDINAIPCTTPGPTDPACLVEGAQWPCNAAGFCECKTTPDVTVVVIQGGKGPPFPGDPECFNDDAKITGSVVLGTTSSPISGAELLLTYDPTCLEYVSIAGSPTFPDAVYGPVVDQAAGTIFMAVGIGFGGTPTSGNVDIAEFSFIKIGTCNSCEICFSDNNPRHTYLSDVNGQKVLVTGHCSTPIKANNTVVLTTPKTFETNADCNVPTAVENWPAPSATDTCGTSQVFCRGEHDSGLQYSQDVVLHGGELPMGKSTFCCYAVSDYCGKEVGCPPDTNCHVLGSDGKPLGCWTVTVNDETSMDIDIGLQPGTVNGRDDTMTRCIKFTLYSNCAEQPLVFTDNVTFGGLFEFVGKSTGKVKIPGSNNWSCITAQDQLHTLRSCYSFTAGDCVGGQLKASFKGDPRLGGNWLIGGNLDGWKKELPSGGTGASLDIIDILDYGTFVSQYGMNYGFTDTPCGTPGPNADINGDGVVDINDYAYVSANFLTSSKQCCCGPQAASVNAVTEISVAQLRAMGLGDLAVADLNGDGVLNMADMALFDQGVRPSKTVPTKGGTRSSGSR